MKQPTTLKESSRLLHTATYAAVATAILLVLIKLAAWLWTGSVSILASLVDSMMDSLVSFINMLAVRYSLAQQTQGVLGVHDLRTRQSGQNIFIQLHLELDEQLPLLEAHGIADAVDAKILALMPGAEIIIHQDPVKNKNEE